MKNFGVYECCCDNDNKKKNAFVTWFINPVIVQPDVMSDFFFLFKKK